MAQGLESYADLYKGAVINLYQKPPGRHLITFYWWGLYPLSGEQNLLEQYIQKASFKERAHIMNYVGQVLENSEELPKEIEIRLME